MALKALAPRKLYVPEMERDEPEESQVRFKLRRMRADKYAEAQDKLLEFMQRLDEDGQDGEGAKPRESRTRVNSGTQELVILIYGIEGVENFRDEETNEVIGCPQLRPSEIERNPAPMIDFVSKIPPRVRTELARAIIGDSKLKKAESGNSATQSPLLTSGSATADDPNAVAAH